jgi:hypothetical protein
MRRRSTYIKTNAHAGPLRCEGPRKTEETGMKLKNPVKRRSASAAALADARYRKRVVKSAKVYSRKGKTALSDEDSE